MAGRGSVRRESCPMARASVVVFIIHIYTCSFSAFDQIIFNEVPASYQAAVAGGKEVLTLVGSQASPFCAFCTYVFIRQPTCVHSTENRRAALRSVTRTTRTWGN